MKGVSTTTYLFHFRSYHRIIQVNNINQPNFLKNYRINFLVDRRLDEWITPERFVRAVVTSSSGATPAKRAGVDEEATDEGEASYQSRFPKKRKLNDGGSVKGPKKVITLNYFALYTATYNFGNMLIEIISFIH